MTINQTRCQNAEKRMKSGVPFAVGAFFIWGIAPLYYKLVEEAGPAEILVHRVVWCVACLMPTLLLPGQWRAFARVWQTPGAIRTLSASAALLACNALIFLWAIVHDRVLETSIGYYINPLFNVLLGVMFFRERLRPAQLFAVALAGAGILVLVFAHGGLPWVAIGLPLAFGLYGYLRKRCPVDPLNGLLVEMLLLAPLALAYWVFLWYGDAHHFGRANWSMSMLLMLAGPISTVPLCLFVAATHRMKLSTVGFLQYIAPSLSFLLAVFVFREPFGWPQFTTCACIWLALLIFSLDMRRA